MPERPRTHGRVAQRDSSTGDPDTCAVKHEYRNGSWSRSLPVCGVGFRAVGERRVRSTPAQCCALVWSSIRSRPPRCGNARLTTVTQIPQDRTPTTHGRECITGQACGAEGRTRADDLPDPSAGGADWTAGESFLLGQPEQRGLVSCVSRVGSDHVRHLSRATIAPHGGGKSIHVRSSMRPGGHPRVPVRSSIGVSTALAVEARETYVETPNQ